MVIERDPWIVYVKVDERNRIIAINSSAFIEDTEGWIKIDEGYELKHHHAQGNYFPGAVFNRLLIPVYKLADGKPVARTPEEIDADIAALPPPPPSQAERIKELEDELVAAKILLGLEV